MVVDQARQRIDDLEHPQQVTVMLGAVCHDLGKPPTTAFIDGRIRSMEHEQAGVAPATRLLDRLNVHTLDGFDVRAPGARHRRAPPEAARLRQVGDAGRRRRVPAARAEGRSRAAGAGRRVADCQGRAGDFDCSAIDWFLERARELGVEHAAPDAAAPGPAPARRSASRPGPRMGEILRQVYERQLDGRVTSIEEGIQAARDLIAALPKQE